MSKTQKSNQQIAMMVGRNTIFGNLFLSILKLFAGVFGHSQALISDGIDSLSDVFSTVIAMVGVKLAARQADTSHPYGHERFECVTALILSFIIAFAGIMIGWNGINSILDGSYAFKEVPGFLAMGVAIVSIAGKEGMFWYTRFYAKRIRSSALMANAWNYRSDALSSVGSFIGILGSMLGWPICDSIASVVICVFILRSAYQVFMDAVSKMTDQSCDKETEEAILNTVSQVEGVARVDLVHTRQFGSRSYVDIEISAPSNLTLLEGHNIAQKVHDAVEQDFPEVKHCMVHVNPYFTTPFQPLGHQQE